MVVLLEGMSYGNSLVEFYQQLPVGRKDQNFGVKYRNILVTRHLLNYKEMFVGTLIYIRYVVISIILFTGKGRECKLTKKMVMHSYLLKLCLKKNTTLLNFSLTQLFSTIRKLGLRGNKVKQ